MDGIYAWLTHPANWLIIGGIGWWIDQGLKILAPLTKNTLDDNLADILGKLLARFFPRA